ncbi:hypothetical protein DFP72DRAFT_909980 [Ephemerocybe angulata]|uniref:Uncharacterized protein n=1 Tax=Ephemerocybe angulata TaxID=980116 RepID=A0A8H6HRI5_9AGAR|nr:hypothetical protein DFP72DRAFT_909980 [Tulosesus angulatus]
MWQESERQFSAGTFEDILYELPTKAATSQQRSRRSRATYQFPNSDKLNAEARAVVVYRCMRRAGFDSFGELLKVYFSGEHTFSQYKEITQALSEFMKSKKANESEHPVAIVDYFFRHPNSRLNLDGKVDRALSLTVPSYALPPSVRLDGTYAQERPRHSSTKNALLDWSLGRILELVDLESERLLQSSFGFTRSPTDMLNWTNLTSWSITASQEIIATEAPAIFALLSTIAVNENTRSRVKLARHIPTPSAPTPEPIPPSSPAQYLPALPINPMDEDQEEENSPQPAEDELPAPPNRSPFLETTPPSLSGVPADSRRDPWLGVTVAILALLYFRYKYAIVFATVIGIFLFTCNANRDIISILGRMGLTVAYDTILEGETTFTPC